MPARMITCTCCRARVHIALIHDLKVQRPVCVSCHVKRQAERRTYPIHYSRGLPPKTARMIPL